MPFILYMLIIIVVLLLEIKSLNVTSEQQMFGVQRVEWKGRELSVPLLTKEFHAKDSSCLFAVKMRLKKHSFEFWLVTMCF